MGARGSSNENRLFLLDGLASGIAVQVLKQDFRRVRLERFDAFCAYSFEACAFSIKQNSFLSGNSASVGTIEMAGALSVSKYR